MKSWAQAFIFEEFWLHLGCPSVRGSGQAKLVLSFLSFILLSGVLTTASEAMQPFLLW